jgi:hypothetical protein
MLLIVLALVMTSVGTAAAEKGGNKPSPDPLLYRNVTMTLAYDDHRVLLPGLSTVGLAAKGDACTADGQLVMVEEELGNGTSLTAYGVYGVDGTSEANLWLKTSPELYEPGVPPLGDGCYYGTNPGSDVDGPGFLKIGFDRRGTLVAITWHFDNVAEMSSAPPRGKSGKDGGEWFVVLHKYALTSQSGLVWGWDEDEAGVKTGVVSGDFELWDYTKTDGPLSVVWNLIAEPHLEFNLTIAPQ